jgi:hypothetical protein
MAIRVTDEEVLEILETALGAPALAPFIVAANRVVEDNLVDRDYVHPDETIGPIDDPTLKEIERWLAAHAVAHRDKRVAEDKVGPAAFKYQGKTGMHLESTHYGQMAMDLDPTGALKQLNASQSVPFLYEASGGTPREEAAPEGALS